MSKKIFGITGTVLIISTLFHPHLTINAANEGKIKELALNKVRLVLPESIKMTDKAIKVLSQGLNEMSIQERELFLKFFDPGNTGTIDEDYSERVLENYRKIRGRIDDHIILIYESSNSRCVLMTLYYTDFVRIHVCPYITLEVNQLRIARGIVHEVAHMAFLSLDRSYYYPNFSGYRKLVPDVHAAAGIPVIGFFIREILRTDTLYNADSYAHFAAELYSMDVRIDQDDPDEPEYILEEMLSPEVKFLNDSR